MKEMQIDKLLQQWENHQIFSLAFLIPSLSIYTFPISFFSSLFSAVYSYGKCFCQMASADTMASASASLPHKVGGYISLGREIWTQESNWNDAVNGIYGLCAFYYYATSILFSFLSTLPRLPRLPPAVCNFPTFSTFGHFIKRRRRRP